jgi:hypothetical protein
MTEEEKALGWAKIPEARREKLVKESAYQWDWQRREAYGQAPHLIMKQLLKKEV